VVSRRRPILNSCNVAILALGLVAETICLSQNGNALTNSKSHSTTGKHGAAHPVAASAHNATKAGSNASLPKQSETQVKPNGSESVTQIRNLVLPIPTINERLIRDIMVGKPTEVVPNGIPDGANPTPDPTAVNSVAPPKDSEMVSGEAFKGTNETEKKPEAPEAQPAKPSDHKADDKGGMKPQSNNISTTETTPTAVTEAAQPSAKAEATPSVTAEATPPVAPEATQPTTTEVMQSATTEAAQPLTTAAQPAGLQPDLPQNNDFANLPLHRAIGDNAAGQDAAQMSENVQEESIDSASVVKPILFANTNSAVPPNKVILSHEPVTLESNQATLESKPESKIDPSTTLAVAKTEEFDVAAVVPAMQKAEEFDAAATVPAAQNTEKVEPTTAVQKAEKNTEQKIEEFDGATATAAASPPKEDVATIEPVVVQPALLQPANPTTNAGADPTTNSASNPVNIPANVPVSVPVSVPANTPANIPANEEFDSAVATPAKPPETKPENTKSANVSDSTKFDETISLNLPEGAILSGEVAKDKVQEEGVIIVDNDEAQETQNTIAYKELPTNEGKTKVLIGAQFPVVMSSQITSKTSHRGDAIEARLKYDLKIGDKLIARKGSPVYGHINYCLKARTAMGSMFSVERWYRNSGCVGVSFDEIVNDKNEHIPLVAVPARTPRIIKNKGEGRILGVNHAGQVAGPWSQQLTYKAIRVGLNAAMAPAGVFSFGAMPVALGVIGAANPSFAFMKPVGLNVRHRRIKGFAWGFLSGFPGSFLIEDTVIRGQEAVIKPGDEFLAEFKEEFTGEPQTDASIIAGASAKVHGQVMPETKKPAKSHGKETAAAK
jgi:hypothetical protein